MLNKLTYQKAAPSRDARIFIIVCEGSNREPDYFDFFDRLTSKIKVKTVPSEGGKSSPKHLIENAIVAENKYNSDQGDYVLWIVVDVDKWINHGHIHTLFQETKNKNWRIAISNPCFEVWLAYHIASSPPNNIELSKCKSWKSMIPNILEGGFNSDKHPTLIKTAIENSAHNYSEQGYIPNIGSTQVFRLAKDIYELAKDELKKYK